MLRKGSVGVFNNNGLHKVQTFAGGGGGSTELFRVYGVVQLDFIFGIVVTILDADVDNLSLDLFPDAGALVALATLVDSATAPVGSVFVKMTDATNALVLRSSAVPFVAENTNWREPFVSPIVGEQGDGTPTHIRSTFSGVATSGAIDWHVDWKAMSAKGHLEVA